MTPDEARALFDDVLDGELDPARQKAFDALLREDSELRAEFTELERVVKATRSLAIKPDDTAPLDLLSGVQQRLRERSGGRFYRDRFAEARGRSPQLTWMVMLSLVVLVCALAWLGFDAGLFGATP